MTDLLAQLPGYALRRAANAVMGELAPILAGHDLKIAEAAVLLLVREQANLTSSQIGKTLDIQRANMVPLLNRLESAGLIHREPIDKKSLAINLTKDGEAKICEAGAAIDTFEKNLLARVPAEHRDHLLPALNAIWR
ncbi:MarR family winged helix-turn-helix transcriptional regulator [Novosphingobium beihaiensis]|uniref:MarR family transcriptional regulator n=1 Tax=Novosphingobium beihaiensis TaxID=2930389 RepID=A0ABT0BLF6_9SPHN|nr:MarR family transcriptional regulator [Novosphingobium beihaiensis]MCJ2185874.1 MarR family transcriptional regulator [Novosphingobium beihaiensis]